MRIILAICMVLILCITVSCDNDIGDNESEQYSTMEVTPTAPLSEDNRIDDTEPNPIEQYYNEEIPLSYEDIYNEDIKTLVDKQTVEFILTKKDTFTILTLEHQGMYYLDSEYCLSDEEIDLVKNNDKYSMDYQALPEFENIDRAQWAQIAVINQLSDCSPEERITDLRRSSHEEDERETALFISSSELNVKGDYAYKYLIYDNPIFGKSIAYLIYNKESDEGVWTPYSFWGCCENIPNCTIEEIHEIKLLESAMREQYGSFSYIISFSNSQRPVTKYLDDGRTVTIFFDVVDYESDHYCCTRIEYNELSIFDILKEEHMPEKLLAE